MVESPKDVIEFIGRRWHKVLEDAPVAVLFVDSGGIIVWANRAFVTRFGYSRQEIVGKQVNFLLPEGRRDRHAGYIAEWFQHPYSRPMGTGLHIQGRNKNGALLNLDIQLVPIEEDEGILAEAWIRERPPADDGPQLAAPPQS